MKIQEDAEIIPRPLGRAPLLLPELPFSLFSALSVNAFFSLYPQPRLLTFSLCFFFVSPPLVQTLFVSHGPALLFPTQLVAIPTNTMATVNCSATRFMQLIFQEARSPLPFNELSSTRVLHGVLSKGGGKGSKINKINKYIYI